MERSSWMLCVILVFLYAAGLSSHASKIRCRERVKIEATLDLIENFIIKARDLTPNCTLKVGNSSRCDDKGTSRVFLDVSLTLMADIKGYYLSCLTAKKKGRQPGDPADCSEILEKGNKKSGLYRIWPRSINDSMQVFCDMETDGGGWTVVQRRGNFSAIPEDFYRDWRAYAAGFGNLTKEFWIGNENLHILTSQGDYSLRFDVEDNDGEKGFAVYKYFYVGDRKTDFRLNITEYTGDVGDCMDNHNGLPFTTKDKQNDQADDNCAHFSYGGWWYKDCYYCNPNGVYEPGTESDKVIRWNAWRKAKGLSSIRMMIRRSSWGGINST